MTKRFTHYDQLDARGRASALVPAVLFTMFVAKHADAQRAPDTPSPSSSVVSPAQPTSVPPAPAPSETAAPGASQPLPSSFPPPPTAAQPASSDARVSSSPAPVSAPAASAPPQAAPPEPVPAAPPLAAPGYSTVHLGSSYAGTWLELASRVDRNGWQRACLAPCDARLYVDGTVARVSAPGMTTSNVFRIAPGAGTALVRVDGGAASSRTLGIIGLAAGIPTTLAGGALYGYGSFADRDGLRIGGAAVLGLGALAVLASIPFLISGSTTVRDGNGSVIARAPSTLPVTF